MSRIKTRGPMTSPGRDAGVADKNEFEMDWEGIRRGGGGIAFSSIRAEALMLYAEIVV